MQRRVIRLGAELSDAMVQGELCRLGSGDEARDASEQTQEIKWMGKSWSLAFNVVDN